MLIFNVDISVKPGMNDAFVRATLQNVAESRQELGVAAFDLLVDPSDDHHFLLVEVYRTSEAPLAHKGTAHYQAWRDAVEPMMQCARSSTKWHEVITGDGV